MRSMRRSTPLTSWSAKLPTPLSLRPRPVGVTMMTRRSPSLLPPTTAGSTSSTPSTTPRMMIARWVGGVCREFWLVVGNVPHVWLAG